VGVGIAAKAVCIASFVIASGVNCTMRSRAPASSVAIREILSVGLATMSDRPHGRHPNFFEHPREGLVDEIG
jgi:hypothetical protein